MTPSTNARRQLGDALREHYERVWQRGDPWDLDGSALDQTRHARELELLGDRRYRRALEIGCAAGALTRGLAGLADRLLAIDIAPSAIQRAQAAWTAPGHVEFRAVNVMDLDARAEGPWDLIVVSETIYCLAWLYPLFDLVWLASELLAATQERGRLLLTNTIGAERDHLLRPWMVRTYRDLFRNVGYEVRREDVLQGAKQGVTFEVLLSVFERPAAASTPGTQPDHA